MNSKKSETLGRVDTFFLPFRYPSNIIYALESILPIIPEHRVYIEPFCGGASTFFAKPKAEDNWLNDIDSELIETYRAIIDSPDKLFSFIEKEDSSEQRYDYFKSKFTPRNSFETAMRWFYLNKTSQLEKMSMFWERDEGIDLRSTDWNKLISECSKKLQSVKLTSGDFEQVISEAPMEAFLFVAPPYSIHHSPEQCRLHKFPFEREAHFRLAEILKRRVREVKFMITYNENEELRRMYSWGEQIRIVNLPNKPPLKGEIIIMNYEI